MPHDYAMIRTDDSLTFLPKRRTVRHNGMGMAQIVEAEKLAAKAASNLQGHFNSADARIRRTTMHVHSEHFNKYDEYRKNRVKQVHNNRLLTNQQTASKRQLLKKTIVQTEINAHVLDRHEWFRLRVIVRKWKEETRRNRVRPNFVLCGHNLCP